jgi:hypothetical protein
MATLPNRQYLHNFGCGTRGITSLWHFCLTLTIHSHQPMHFLLHSHYWLYIPINKKSCTNTSSAYCLMEEFLYGPLNYTISQAHNVFDRLMMICRHWPTLLRQFASKMMGLWADMVTACSTKHCGCSPLYVGGSEYFWTIVLTSGTGLHCAKVSAEDTTFTLTDMNGTLKTVVVPKGLDLALEVAGLHYNRKILVRCKEMQ